MSNKRVNPFKLKLHLLECEADEKDKKISNLEAKLAEKETDLSLARNEINTLKHNLNVSHEHDKVMCEQYFEKCKETNQDKISFTIEQLEKVKAELVKLGQDYSLNWCGIKIYNFIDNQIKSLKGGE